jgi:glucose-1-phosphate cytidylyltransferase
MKVVIFCGGLGTRLREGSDTIPKPLVRIGPRPIIWHIMKYYAHFGHKDFILCLGYKGDMIRDFFLNYDPNESRDFLMKGNSQEFSPSTSDIDDWTIQFVETGLHSNIGERLVKVRKYLEGERIFLANYSDQLSDLPLDQHIERFEKTDAVAGFVSVRPSQSFHVIESDQDNRVTRVEAGLKSEIRINGGFMVLRQSIFDYMKPGEELVEEPFARLVKDRKLFAYPYDGFWKAMDTFKDKISFDRLWGQEEMPWRVWLD